MVGLAHRLGETEASRAKGRLEVVAESENAHTSLAWRGAMGTTGKKEDAPLDEVMVKDVCMVLDRKYKACVSTAGMLHATELSSRCGGFFSDLMEHCSNVLPVSRRGDGEGGCGGARAMNPGQARWTRRRTCTSEGRWVQLRDGEGSLPGGLGPRAGVPVGSGI